MSDFSTTVEEYLAAWNETDPVARRARIEKVWAPEATYTDPLVAIRGHEQIADTIGAVQQQFPAFVFTRVGEIDAHHEQIRFRWGLGPAGQEPVVIGFDVAVTDAHGRLQQVYGFLDKVPAA